MERSSEESTRRSSYSSSRMVLKRCVYGVDKNPMAVELAKVVALAAYLHGRRAALASSTITSAPGDSLFGLLGAGCDRQGRGKLGGELLYGTRRCGTLERSAGSGHEDGLKRSLT